MIKSIIILIILSFSVLSQAYRDQYVSKIHLSSDPTSGFEYVIVAPEGLSESYTFSLPATIGNPGEVLMSLGDGSYTWTNPSVTNATPGGANTNIQFSNNNTFAGSNNLTWNNSSNRMFVNTSSGDFKVNVKDWVMSGTNGTSGALSLHTGNASGYRFNFRPNSAMTTSATLTLPSTYGTSGQFLVTDGSGNLYWTSAAVGGSFDCIGQGTGGGSGNSATSDDSFIGGGNNNNINSSSDDGFIGGGTSNEITGSSDQSAIISGTSNSISGSSDRSVIGAGANNSIAEVDNSAIGAGRFNTLGDEADNSLIGAGEYNYIGSEDCAIPGGYSNTISEDAENNIIGAGQNNFINYGQENGIMSGYNNTIASPNAPSSPYPNNSAIAGGANNIIHEDQDFIGGGSNHYIDADYSAIGGGYGNSVEDVYSAVLGGHSNTVTGEYSMAFGYQSEADADYTVAIGRRAVADNQGAFVFADNTDAELNSSSNNRMEMRFSGGYRFFTNTALTTGMTLSAGGNSWASVSDKNLKTNILDLNYTNILDKISDLSISSWAYTFIDEKDNGRNYGPMAQDFYKLFGKDKYGNFGSDKEIISNHITNVGIAALKGLIIKYESGNEKIQQLNIEQEEILRELMELESEITELSNKVGGVK